MFILCPCGLPPFAAKRCPCAVLLSFCCCKALARWVATCAPWSFISSALTADWNEVTTKLTWIRWLIRQINGADKQIAGLTPYLPWWCSQTSTVGFIPQGAAKRSQLGCVSEKILQRSSMVRSDGRLGPRIGCWCSRVEAGAWSRCLVWVLAPFPAKSHLEWL